jgi:hypothetical protein
MEVSEKIKGEIVEVIADEKNKDVILKTEWIANAVMNPYFKTLPETNAAEMVRYLSLLQCRRMVREIISKKLDGNGSDNRQYVIPGYEHLQTHYAVRRDGTPVGVPISLMTDQELEAKLQEYEKMGSSCFAHAREIAEYLENKKRKEEAHA